MTPRVPARPAWFAQRPVSPSLETFGADVVTPDAAGTWLVSRPLLWAGTEGRGRRPGPRPSSPPQRVCAPPAPGLVRRLSEAGRARVRRQRSEGDPDLAVTGVRGTGKGVLGLLFKRCTLLLPTKDRLKYIHKILSEVSCFKFSGCSTPLQCVGLPCYGIFLQTLTAGWDELECQRVYNYLCELTNLSHKMQTVVCNKPGSSQKLELRIRLFCRNVLLDHWTQRSDFAFWLTRILKPWPMVNQARLLYIIFGPASPQDGQVIWQEMVEGPTDESSLKSLANAIKLLYDTSTKEWTADDVISLVDELSVVPQEWLLENNARLLILSGSNICFTFMASKAVNGRTIDLSRLIVFLALVCEKELYCMDWTVRMMQKVCKVFNTAAERKSFLQSVANAFACVTMEILQPIMSGERDDDDRGFLDLFHLLHAQANFHKEVLYLTMNASSS
ncbi:hypothetical protein STEG23_035175 [Scotinomys teguina]